MQLNLAAPAKINLSLKVLGKRSDGYHNLASLFLPVDLYDELILSDQSDELKLICPNSDLPQDRSNLAWKAAEIFYTAIDRPARLSIRLNKHIPAGAGLGGGSSDAAAVLKGANQLCGRPLGLDRLREMALKLGADVPFFIEAKPAWAQGVGEILHRVDMPELHLLLVNPGLEISTAWVFSKLGKSLTEPRPAYTIESPNVNSCKDLISLTNDLEFIVEERWPVIGEIRRRLIQTGALAARMSGSGSTMFGLFESKSAVDKAMGALLIERSWRKYSVSGLS